MLNTSMLFLFELPSYFLLLLYRRNGATPTSLGRICQNLPHHTRQQGIDALEKRMLSICSSYPVLPCAAIPNNMASTRNTTTATASTQTTADSTASSNNDASTSCHHLLA